MSPALKMEHVRARVGAFDPPVRQAILDCLDELTRPLTVREVERALKALGVHRDDAPALASAIKGMAIVAIIPRASDAEPARD